MEWVGAVKIRKTSQKAAITQEKFAASQLELNEMF